VWRSRTLALLVLVLLAGAATALVSSGSAAATPTSSHPTTCDLRYHAFSCPVPQGPTIDPCSLLTDGLTSCPIHTPDFNPADWVSWLSCSIVAETSTIWDNLVGDVTQYIGSAVDGVLTAVWNPFDELLGDISRGVVGALHDVVNAVLNVFNGVVAAVQPLGPFATVAVVVVSLGLFLIGSILLYFFLIAIIAIFKTLFNLL
jgi:hypothetical protein